MPWMHIRLKPFSCCPAWEKPQIAGDSTQRDWSRNHTCLRLVLHAENHFLSRTAQELIMWWTRQNKSQRMISSLQYTIDVLVSDVRHEKKNVLLSAERCAEREKFVPEIFSPTGGWDRIIKMTKFCVLWTSIKNNLWQTTKMDFLFVPCFMWAHLINVKHWTKKARVKEMSLTSARRRWCECRTGESAAHLQPALWASQNNVNRSCGEILKGWCRCTVFITSAESVSRAKSHLLKENRRRERKPSGTNRSAAIVSDLTNLRWLGCRISRSDVIFLCHTDSYLAPRGPAPEVGP